MYFLTADPMPRCNTDRQERRSPWPRASTAAGSTWPSWSRTAKRLALSTLAVLAFRVYFGPSSDDVSLHNTASASTILIVGGSQHDQPPQQEIRVYQSRGCDAQTWPPLEVQQPNQRPISGVKSVWFGTEMRHDSRQPVDGRRRRHGRLMLVQCGLAAVPPVETHPRRATTTGSWARLIASSPSAGGGESLT